MLTQTELKKILRYDPEAGLFFWAVDTYRSKRGSVAGTLSALTRRKDINYRVIGVNRRNYLAHRLAFLYMTGSFPDGVVDHINHDSSDNRWANLRKVTPTDNNRNTRMHHDNKSGICGVWLDRERWVAKIGVNSSQICIGRFNNLFDAVCARKSAEIKHGYHKNHGAV